MTKEQKADALLCAAKHWQNDQWTSSCVFCNTDDICELYDPADTFSAEFMPQQRLIDSASAALSEVAAIGFDIVDAETGK